MCLKYLFFDIEFHFFILQAEGLISPNFDVQHMGFIVKKICQNEVSVKKTAWRKKSEIKCQQNLFLSTFNPKLSMSGL
jgi:hypothetical protein